MATTDPLPTWPATTTLSIRAVGDRFRVEIATPESPVILNGDLGDSEAAACLTGYGLNPGQADALLECAVALYGRRLIVRQ